MTDDAGVARSIIDTSAYLVLATADADGTPWATPVFFAADGYGAFVWVSSPTTRHSRNVAVRPQVGIVVFDSGAAPGEGQGVYVAATAAELTGEAIDDGLDVYARACRSAGIRVWTRDDVVPPARHRIYRAEAQAHFVLDPHDERVPVHLA